jgi:hypothetical protein
MKRVSQGRAVDPATRLFFRSVGKGFEGQATKLVAAEQ